LEEFGSGSFIQEFVSGGLKITRLRYFAPLPVELQINVKGITLNYENSKVVNFTSLKRHDSGRRATCTCTQFKRFKRRHGGLVLAEPETKEYKVVF
jgi:hypothetical protein